MKKTSRHSNRHHISHRGLLWRVVDAVAPFFAVLDRPLGMVERLVLEGWGLIEPWLILAIVWLHLGLAVSITFIFNLLARKIRPIPWPVRLAVLLGVEAWLAFRFGIAGREIMLSYANYRPEVMEVLENSMAWRSFATWETVSLLVGAACVLVIPFTLVRRRFSLFLFKAVGAAFMGCWVYLLHFLLRCPSHLFDTSRQLFNKFERNELWVVGTMIWLPGLILAALFLFCQAMTRMQEIYGVRISQESLGDKIYASLASGGRDPRFRSSVYWSTCLFLAVIVGPLLMRGCGMEDPYGLPQGSGNPVVEMVRIKQPKKKPKLKFVLSSTSPFIFERPEIDDSQILQELDKTTEAEYQASQIQGKLGKGGGTTGGWPTKMPGRVRFIRLRYGGGDWDQGMGKGADYNLLVQFNKITGFAIAHDTEAIDIYRLRRFPKKGAPPFVYVTGSRGFSLNSADINTFRWYCIEEAGMIIADDGGGDFGRNLRATMSRVFPEKKWVDIPNDDIIYRQPFQFPNGAPSLWHHGGRRALGMKHDGRWIVFYHPGDMKDAWKDGHSGASEAVAAQAYRLGVNLMNYSFNQYIGIHYGE